MRRIAPAPPLSIVLHLLSASPAWRAGTTVDALPNTLPGWTIAFLALQGDWVPRERLLALLWPDAAAEEAQHNLRVDLHRMRGLLADWGLAGALQSERRRVRLALPTDVALLRRAAANADEPLPSIPGSLLASMDFPGFAALREWAELERASLAALWRRAALARIERPGADATERVALAQALIDSDPLDETALAHLMRALREVGRGDDADRRYEAYRERLARELGSEPAPALRALAGAGVGALAPLEVVDRRSFVGRRTELAELRRRLDPALASARWHTIVGPGGAGKSSLARRALAACARPATWVDLQDLSHLDEVVDRIAQRLGLTLRDGAEATREIARALGPMPRVLALDNAEHVDGLAEFVARLLAAVPTLVVLATSRRPLDGAGEALLPLEGLARPDEDSRDAEAAPAFDAVQLFEQRARAVQPGFSAAAHIDSVLAIVDAVGALPLAIELAANWVRLLPPEQIARDLRSSLDLLEHDIAQPRLPARPEHSSMGVVLERSWALLEAAERHALEALAVFVGGFEAAAAKAVAQTPMPLLAALVDKGLLQVDDGGRFGMHPLVAAFVAARQRVDGDGGCRALRERHAAFFAGWLQEAVGRAADDDAPVVAAVQAESSNLYAAWRHALDAGLADLAGRMLPAWRRYFESTGRYVQACAHFRLLSQLPATDADSLAMAHLRAALAHFLVRTNDPEHARPLALAALAQAEAAQDGPLTRAVVSTLGGCAMAQGRFDEARAWFQRVRQLNEAIGDRRGIAAAENSLCLVATYLGRMDEALAHAGEALVLYEGLGNHMGIARCRMNLAQAHAFLEDWAQVRQAAADALHHATRHGLSAIAAMAEFWLGAAALEGRDPAAARKHLERARQRCRTEGHPVFEFKADYHLALLDLREGRHLEGARALLSAARAAFERGWSEDLLYLGLFLAEALRELALPDAAARLLRSVQAAPDDVSDAAIRNRATRLLASLPAARDVEPTEVLAFDALSSCMATCDTPDELAQRLRSQP